MTNPLPKTFNRNRSSHKADFGVGQEREVLDRAKEAIDYGEKDAKKMSVH